MLYRDEVMLVLGLVFGFGLVPAAVVAAGVVGGMALLRARHRSGEQRQVLRMIALHLLEAPVNSTLIGGLVWVYKLGLTEIDPRITLPMVALLIPALGIDFQIAEHRGIAIRLLALGLLRWITTFAIFAHHDGRLIVWLGLGGFLLLGDALWCVFVLRHLDQANDQAATVGSGAAGRR